MARRSNRTNRNRGYTAPLGGLPMDDNNLGKSAYDDVEPGGHFLGSAHTMANYETAYYDAQLSDSENFEQWEENGSRDTERRTFERWNEMLAAYELPPLSDDIDGALLDYMARRKSEIEGRWY